jgi:Rap1a immunity proteins
MRMVLAVLATLCSSSFSAHSMESANELLSSCETFLRAYSPAGTGFRLRGDNPASYECWGYINAIQQLSAILDDGGNTVTGACPEPETTAVQIVRVVVAYAQKHPERLHLRAGVVALAAMRGAFPCGR